MAAPAPKPDNFDDLTATWNDPAAFAREQARYYEQLRDPEAFIDFTEPRRSTTYAEELGGKEHAS